MTDAPDKREIIENALESMPGGAVVTDEEGKIVYLSKSYAKILEVDATEALGRYARDVIPRSRMHIVSSTGREEIGSIFTLKNGESIIVNRLPVKKDGKVIGSFAFSTLTSADAVNTNATMARVMRLLQEVSHYRNELTKLRGAKYSLDQIIGNTPEMEKMKQLVARVAQTKSTVLISGETGTGKELVAHALHQESPRSHHSFITVNCAAIPPELMESELFGYEEGAFTGAKKGGRAGRFEMANFGTLLLDEIHQLPLHLQSKLLRVIQEKELERVGGTALVPLDVRLICTTNQDLLKLVNKDKFREDLYYRINVVTVNIPPLRDRREDIVDLTSHLIAKINKNLGTNITGIDDEVLELFRHYRWPGNIRELEHTLERAANIALSGKLALGHMEPLRLRVINEANEPTEPEGLANYRAKTEKEMIIRTLEQTNGNVAAAAKVLNIHRTVLYDKLKKYGIR